MKNRIVSLIVSFENQYVGKLPRKGVSFNSDTYYAPFIALYEQNKKEFADTVLMFCYAVPVDEAVFEELSYYCKERIRVHALRLCLYFQIDPMSVPFHLRSVLLSSLKMRRSDDMAMQATGRRLYDACIIFLNSVVSKCTPEDGQHFYKDKEYPLPLFKNLFDIDDVTDVYSAILYMDLREFKLVKKPPDFLIVALQGAAVYNYLYNGVLWWDFLYYQTAQKQKRDISLLREAGFVKIPDLLEKVLAEMNTQLRPSDFFYTGKKVELSRNLCLKYKSEIEKCMNEEKETVNSFIRKNAYMK